LSQQYSTTGIGSFPAGTFTISHGTYTWQGKLSDVVIYNRVLSSAEIAILARKSDPMLDGLILPCDPQTCVQPLAINDRHWVGRSSDWHSADNWSRALGGKPGAGVPNEKTNVLFD
jgi:hypothetical protein